MSVELVHLARRELRHVEHDSGGAGLQPVDEPPDVQPLPARTLRDAGILGRRRNRALLHWFLLSDAGSDPGLQSFASESPYPVDRRRSSAEAGPETVPSPRRYSTSAVTSASAKPVSTYERKIFAISPACGITISSSSAI